MASRTPRSGILTGTLRLVSFGAPRLDRLGDGTARTLFGQGKPVALLAFLASSPRRTASRERVSDIFWGDRDPEDGRKLLRQTVWMVVNACGDGFITSGPEGLTLAATVEHDADVFERLVRAGELDAAIAAYTGNFYPNFASPGAAEFERWAELERTRIRSLFIHAAESLTRRALDSGRFAAALSLAQRIREFDTHGETGWRLLLESLVASGDVVGARAEAEQFEHWLAEEECVAEPATLAVLRVARNIRAPSTTTAPAPLAAELIGREQEFSRLYDLWSACRTQNAQFALILGDGGIGKTRLVTDLRSRFVASRARTAFVRAHSAERHVPYACLATLAAEVARLAGASGVAEHSASVLLALNPSLSSVFRGSPDSSTGEETVRRRGIAFAELLGAVADDAPVAVIVDDLHWCDNESLRCLSFVASRISSERIFFILTARPNRALPPWPEGTVVLRLLPLDVGQVEQFVSSIAPLGDSPACRALPSLLLRCSRGVPLIVLEALRLAMDRDALQLSDTVWQSESIDQLDLALQPGLVLARRLGALDPNEGALLIALAVSELPLAIADLTAAAGLDIESATAVATALEQRGLVISSGDAWRTAHDEIAAAALVIGNASDVAAVHRALGLRFAASAGPDLRRRAVHHLAEAGDWTHASRVVADVLRHQRLRGPARDAVAALLGDSATSDRVARMVRELPLSVRFPQVRQVAIAAGLLIVAFGATIFWRGWFAEPASREAELLVVTTDSAGVITARHVGVAMDGWDIARPIDLSAAPTERWATSPIGTPFLPSPAGDAWATETAFPDSGSLDVELVQASGKHQRLTFTPGDDKPMAFSPDGSLLLIGTSRWTHSGHLNLAIIDARDGTLVRRLTTNVNEEPSVPTWSADGSRIAYIRRDLATDARVICWISVDGTRNDCFAASGFHEYPIFGWLDANRVYFVRDAGNTSYALNLHDGKVERLGYAFEMGSVFDASMRWRAESNGDIDPDAPIRVSPAGQSGRARVLSLKGLGAQTVAFWWIAPAPDYVDRVAIVRPASMLHPRVPYLLRANTVTRNGVVARPELVSWQSSNSRVAMVDSAGVFVATDTGTVIVTASNGGWRTVSDTIHITSSAERIIAEERWGGEVEKRWRYFGEPRPQIVNDGLGGSAFLNDGDGEFYSGAYSRQAFDARRGLAIDVDLSTPITQTQWQMVSISLMPDIGFAKLATWDHRSGYLIPRGGEKQPNCNFSYPHGEGPHTRSVATPIGTLPKLRDSRGPLDVSNGTWYKVRIQLLPDGRCAIAIDGVPLWIGPAAERAAEDYRLVLQGSSVGSRMLVGRVVVRAGVPGDVDWRRVRR